MGKIIIIFLFLFFMSCGYDFDECGNHKILNENDECICNYNYDYYSYYKTGLENCFKGCPDYSLSGEGVCTDICYFNEIQYKHCDYDEYCEGTAKDGKLFGQCLKLK